MNLFIFKKRARGKIDFLDNRRDRVARNVNSHCSDLRARWQYKLPFALSLHRPSIVCSKVSWEAWQICIYIFLMLVLPSKYRDESTAENPTSKMNGKLTDGCWWDYVEEHEKPCHLRSHKARTHASTEIIDFSFELREMTMRISNLSCKRFPCLLRKRPRCRCSLAWFSNSM